MHITFYLNDIHKAAAALLAAFPGEKVFAVNGPMGAGKTTFISAVCRQLGVAEQASSPTYALMNQYETATGQTVFHIDLYRLRDAEEARAAGIEEALYSGAYCFAEWPTVAPELFPANTLCMTLELLPDGQRQLSFSRLA